MDNPVNPNCQIFCILTLGSSSSMLLRPFGGHLTHLYDQSLTVHSTTRRSYSSRTVSTHHSLCGTLHITTQFFSMLLFAVLTYVLCFPLNKQHMTNPTLSFAWNTTNHFQNGNNNHAESSFLTGIAHYGSNPLPFSRFLLRICCDTWSGNIRTTAESSSQAQSFHNIEISLHVMKYLTSDPLNRLTYTAKHFYIISNAVNIPNNINFLTLSQPLVLIPTPLVALIFHHGLPTWYNQ
jgi:hypothetical protein